MIAARLILVVLLVACTPPAAQAAATPASSSGLPAGWHYVSNKASVAIVDVSKVVPTGFRLALPGDWDAHDFDRETVAQNYRDWAAKDPVDAEKISEQSYVDTWAAATKLLAWPRDATRESPRELHVFARWIDHAVTLTDFIRGQTQQYELGGYTKRSSTRITIGDRDASVLRMQYGAIGATHVTSLTAYFLIREREVWDLEFIGSMDDIDRLDAMFDQIAQTFRFL